MQDVQSGTVEMLFNKPISYLAYRMWWQLGSGIYSFFVIGIFCAISIIVLSYLPFLISENGTLKNHTCKKEDKKYQSTSCSLKMKDSNDK